MDDVLLQALVGTAPSAEAKADAKADIPVDSEPPAPATPRLETQADVKQPEPVAKPMAESQPETQAEHRLTPSAAHRHNRLKKWRQNTKDRAPTPGRDLTASSSSDEAGDSETVLFVSPLAAASTASEERERVSPLRITEAVTAWLRDHEVEDVLVPAVVVSSDDSDDSADEEDDGGQPSKNVQGNPFRASSHSSTSSTTRVGSGPGAVEERVAALDEPEPEAETEPEAAWDTLCDPSLFVAKYYRLGEDPQDSPPMAMAPSPRPSRSPSLPPVVALELRPDVSLSRVLPSSDKVVRHEQHDSGVHSDESGDEHQTPTKAHAQAQAEELAAKSAYLLRQLKGQSPGVPCGGICCTLQ